MKARARREQVNAVNQSTNAETTHSQAVKELYHPLRVISATSNGYEREREVRRTLSTD